MLDDPGFTLANAQYEATGLGYHDYPGRPGIGALLTSASWVFQQLRERQDLVFGYQERGWIGWQDVAFVHRVSSQFTGLSSRQDRPY